MIFAGRITGLFVVTLYSIESDPETQWPGKVEGTAMQGLDAIEVRVLDKTRGTFQVFCDEVHLHTLARALFSGEEVLIEAECNNAKFPNHWFVTGVKYV